MFSRKLVSLTPNSCSYEWEPPRPMAIKPFKFPTTVYVLWVDSLVGAQQHGQKMRLLCAALLWKKRYCLFYGNTDPKGPARTYKLGNPTAGKAMLKYRDMPMMWAVKGSDMFICESFCSFGGSCLKRLITGRWGRSQPFMQLSCREVPVVMIRWLLTDQICERIADFMIKAWDLLES